MIYSERASERERERERERAGTVAELEAPRAGPLYLPSGQREALPPPSSQHTHLLPTLCRPSRSRPSPTVQAPPPLPRTRQPGPNSPGWWAEGPHGRRRIEARGSVPGGSARGIRARAGAERVARPLLPRILSHNGGGGGGGGGGAALVPDGLAAACEPGPRPVSEGQRVKELQSPGLVF